MGCPARSRRQPPPRDEAPLRARRRDVEGLSRISGHHDLRLIGRSGCAARRAASA
jgi:hypothetical protein